VVGVARPLDGPSPRARLAEQARHPLAHTLDPVNPGQDQWAFALTPIAINFPIPHQRVPLRGLVAAAVMVTPQGRGVISGNSTCSFRHVVRLIATRQYPPAVAQQLAPDC
jgi:hypothetical protein